MAGRKGQRSGGHNKKPTQLRLHEGNRSRRPIPNEVQPTANAKKPARFKTAAERIAWEKITPPLFACGLATNADQVMLEEMCYWYSQHQQYAYGKHADFGKSERAFKQFERIASKFGMTPSDRAGLDVNKGRPKDDTEEFLKKVANTR